MYEYTTFSHTSIFWTLLLVISFQVNNMITISQVLSSADFGNSNIKTNTLMLGKFSADDILKHFSYFS